MLSRWFARHMVRLLTAIARRLGYIPANDVSRVVERAVRRHEARCPNFNRCQACASRCSRPRAELVRQVVETSRPSSGEHPVQKLDACIVALEATFRQTWPGIAK